MRWRLLLTVFLWALGCSNDDAPVEDTECAELADRLEAGRLRTLRERLDAGGLTLGAADLARLQWDDVFGMLPPEQLPVLHPHGSIELSEAALERIEVEEIDPSNDFEAWLELGLFNPASSVEHDAAMRWLDEVSGGRCADIGAIRAALDGGYVDGGGSGGSDAAPDTAYDADADDADDDASDADDDDADDGDADDASDADDDDASDADADDASEADDADDADDASNADAADDPDDASDADADDASEADAAVDADDASEADAAVDADDASEADADDDADAAIDADDASDADADDDADTAIDADDASDADAANDANVAVDADAALDADVEDPDSGTETDDCHVVVQLLGALSPHSNYEPDIEMNRCQPWPDAINRARHLRGNAFVESTTGFRRTADQACTDCSSPAPARVRSDSYRLRGFLKATLEGDCAAHPSVEVTARLNGVARDAVHGRVFMNWSEVGCNSLLVTDTAMRAEASAPIHCRAGAYAATHRMTIEVNESCPAGDTLGVENRTLNLVAAAGPGRTRVEPARSDVCGTSVGQAAYLNALCAMDDRTPVQMRLSAARPVVIQGTIFTELGVPAEDARAELTADSYGSVDPLGAATTAGGAHAWARTGQRRLRVYVGDDYGDVCSATSSQGSLSCALGNNVVVGPDGMPVASAIEGLDATVTGSIVFSRDQSSSTPSEGTLCTDEMVQREVMEINDYVLGVDWDEFANSCVGGDSCEGDQVGGIGVGGLNNGCAATYRRGNCGFINRVISDAVVAQVQPCCVEISLMHSTVRDHQVVGVRRKGANSQAPVGNDPEADGIIEYIDGWACDGTQPSIVEPGDACFASWFSRYGFSMTYSQGTYLAELAPVACEQGGGSPPPLPPAQGFYCCDCVRDTTPTTTCRMPQASSGGPTAAALSASRACRTYCERNGFTGNLGVGYCDATTGGLQDPQRGDLPLCAR